MSTWAQKVEVYQGADAGAATLGTLAAAGKQLRINTDVVWANEPLEVFANNDIIRSVVGPHGGLFKCVSDASLVESGGYSDQKALVAYSRADIAGEPDGNHIYLKTASNSGAHFAKTDIETIAVTTGDAGQFVASVTVQSENLTNVSEIVAATNSTAGTSLQVLLNGVNDSEFNVQTLITDGISVDLTGFKAQTFDHVIRINDEDGIVTQFSPFVADGATAVAYLFDTSNALANDASRIAQFSNNGIIELAVTPFGGLFRAVSAASEALWGGFTDQDALVSISRADVAGEPDAHIIQLAATSDTWAHDGSVFIEANAASTGGAGNYNAQVNVAANNATITTQVLNRVSTAEGAWIDVVGFAAQTNAFNFRISDAGGPITQFSPMVADGATAVAYLFNTSNTLTTFGSKIVSVRNNGVGVLNIQPTGGVFSGITAESFWAQTADPGIIAVSDEDESESGLANIGAISIQGGSIQRGILSTGTSGADLLLQDDDNNNRGRLRADGSVAFLQLAIANTVRTLLDPAVTDGAAAEAYSFDTSNALANAGARIASFEITGTRKASIDVNGAYFVGANQVVGARVVDARIDDAINSGDATTDGVIDACRDALIAHGLCTAA